jgi:hypothetical protein
MRKTMINTVDENTLSFKYNYLDLEQLAQVEFTSECVGHPVELALLLTSDSDMGWQAASAGEQTIRIVFDQPCAIQHIIVMFEEFERSRTQEFVLLWLMDKESTYREILRQQFHFSPPDTTRQFEDYEVTLTLVKALELRIIPDMCGGEARATLKQLRLA